jgi:hypothetical protein
LPGAPERPAYAPRGPSGRDPSAPAEGSACSPESATCDDAAAELDANPAARPLPDLVLDGAYLRDTTLQAFIDVDDPCLVDDLCVTGLGRRRVVRFGSRIGNTGSADLVVGAPGPDNPYWTFDACHEEYQLDGYARYDLIEPDSGGVVVVGAKSGFCMRDSEPWDPDASAESCRQYDCKLQGVSQSCADNYGSALQCQWIDITDVPAGSYDLRVTVNADRKFEELDYANDVVTVRLEITSNDVVVSPAQESPASATQP